MAKNIAEGSKPSADKEESETLTSAASKAVPCNEKGKQEPLDADKLSTGAENIASVKEEDAQSTDAPDSKQPQETCKVNCNGDPQEKADFEEEEEEEESKKVEPETKESSSEELCSAKPKSTSDEDGDYLSNAAAFPEVDERLDEILKVVHEDLRVQMSQRPVGAPVTTDGENGGKEQKTVTSEEPVAGDDEADGRKTSAAEESAEDKSGSAESLKKTKDSSEVGIVGPPTAVSELINEEELGGDSALSADQEDHVVEWIENSVKVIAEDDSDAKAKRKRQAYEKNLGEERAKSRKFNDAPVISPRKSQRVVSNIIKKSIKWLNKMHAMEGAIENRRNVNTAEEEDKSADALPSSPKIPQSQQNGAALPEETAAAPATSRDHPKRETRDARKAEKARSPRSDAESPNARSRQQLLASTSSQERAKSDVAREQSADEEAEAVEAIKKRKSTNGQLSAVGSPRKKLCVDKREEYILEVVGDDSDTIDELVARANGLKAEIFALKKLAKTKETEWNDILSKRKLKEEAYLRLQRKIQVTMFMENDGQLEDLPPASSSFDSMDWESSAPKEKSPVARKERTAKSVPHQAAAPKTNGESARKRESEMSGAESRQIGEGRQGAIVDVKSIIADHRLKHPDSQVPRRGRRMRNSVNINLGTGGAMVETVMHNTDSRPSSAESCKSNPPDPTNYAKDMLMQFAKMSQQGEPVRVPQNYPNVTLHPVASLSAPQSAAPQPTGSLLHGILTKKTQSPKPATSLSPTLARLLQNSPANAAATAVASTSQQGAASQHLFQNYQNNLDMSQFNNILSSSKARTEITITPVVNTPAQSHSNDLIQMEDVEEETDDRGGSSISAKQVVKDSPPSPSTPPKCQGCLVRPAQFVCAGCANQWYCSRTCQLGAWQTHSDYCPPESENGKTKAGV